MSVVEISKHNGKNHYQTAVALMDLVERGIVLVADKEAALAELRHQIRTGVYH